MNYKLRNYPPEIEGLGGQHEFLSGEKLVRVLNGTEYQTKVSSFGIAEP